MDSDSELISSNISSTKLEDITLQPSNSSTKNGNQTSTLLSTGTTTDFDTTNISSASLTDLTSSNFTETDAEKSRNITRELIVKKQLLHDIQKLKIELSQKNLLVDTLKADHLNQIDDLEDKLADAIHKKQLIQAQYETKIQMYKSDAEKKVALLRTELQESIRTQKSFHRKYEEIASKRMDMNKIDFIHTDISEDEYLDLKGKSEDENISPQDFFSITIYETKRPLRLQIETLLQRLEILSGDLHDKEDELEQMKKEFEEERHLRGELDVRCQKFQVQIDELRGQLSQRSYKNQNYDMVQSERDSLERQIVDLERMCTVYKSELEGKTDQMETIKIQMLEQNQTVALLKQDKEYLSKQVNEITPRFNVMEEKLHQTTRQLDEVKLAREELYEKFLNSREHYKREYEQRTKREIDELSMKTNNELNKIKESTKEMYERENRSLTDAKNNAVLEQQRMAGTEKELQRKYNELLGEFRQLQISSDSKIGDSQNEAKIKVFELDRVQLLHEEALKNVKQLGLQNDTLSCKVEALSKEYYGLKGSSERTITELESKNEELRSKLTIYEKLEQELDDVVMQAAEMTNEDESDRVLFAYGYGANVPSTAKRRMQQSVQLARRVLHLERANTSLRHDVDRETKKRKQIEEEFKSTTNLLNEAQQPYNYLIESIRTRDHQNKTLKKTILTLEDDLRNVKKDHSGLKSSHDQVSSDLERLLNQREEMDVLKQVVMGLKSGHNSSSDSLKYVSKTSSVVYGPQVSSRSTGFNSSHQKPVIEKPVMFTNSEPPTWYTRLKQKNQKSLLKERR